MLSPINFEQQQKLKLQGVQETRGYSTYRNIGRKIIGDVNRDVYALPPTIFLHEIRTRDLTEYADHRAKEGLLPASIALELKVIIAIHNHSKSLEYKVNPNLVAKPPRIKSKNRIFTDLEIQTIYQRAAERDSRMSDLFVFLMETGCRVSEIIESHRSDYDIPSHTFTVYRRKTDSRTELHITPDCLTILAKYADKPEPFSGFSTVVRNLRAVVSDVCNTPENAKVTARDGRATLHTARHTFATRAAKAKIPIHVLATILGHTTPTMTARYSHINSRDASRSVSEEMTRLKHTFFHDAAASPMKH